MSFTLSLSGVILAGGTSTRFGRNKALVHWNGKPLIQHVIDGIRPACQELLIVANREEDYRALSIPVYPDLHTGFGPLSGLESGLLHAHNDWILLTACDMPLVTTGLIAPLIGQIPHQDFDAVLYQSSRGPEPLFALYNKSCLIHAQNAIQQKQYAMHSLLAQLKTQYIQFNTQTPSSPGYQFTNINTIQNLQQLDVKNGI